MPDEPAVAPARGRGGVQAGVRALRLTLILSRDADPQPADDPEVTAARPGPRPDDEPAEDGGEDVARRRERIIFGESDDLLSDVDTGVNENEFKW